MHIPEKYRDRYDLLAANHPWMWEMRDADDMTEGDVAAILRKAADYESSSEALRRLTDSTTVYFALEKLADMVERDYVLRTTYNAACADRRRGFDRFNELQGEVEKLTAERDELKAQLESELTMCMDCSQQACAGYDQLQAERDEWKAKYLGAVNDAEDYKTLWQHSCSDRDEWKAKCEQAMESYADAKDARDTWMANYLQAERAMNKAAGEWARADAELREGSSKVRVGQSNLEWLLEHDRKAVSDFLDCAVNMCNNCAYDKYRIDDKCPSGSEWLMAPHKDANDDSDVSEDDVDANDASRIERLEKRVAELTAKLHDATFDNMAATN